MNYRHLRWATSHENAADKIAHGTNTPRGAGHWAAKLTTEQAEEIRRRYAAGRFLGSGRRKKSPSQYDLAAEYGVSQPTIRKIVHNVSY